MFCWKCFKQSECDCKSCEKRNVHKMKRRIVHSIQSTYYEECAFCGHVQSAEDSLDLESLYYESNYFALAC